MWTPEAIAIGFPNRLFVVGAERKRKVAWPEPTDQVELLAIQARIANQMQRLPVKLDIELEAKERWERWYQALPASEHAKRLDTIGFRLMPVIALTTDKDRVDLETVETTLAILDYELALRCLTDPIDADNTIARLEEKIRRALGAHSSLSKRDLQRKVHANRDGIWAFERALENLQKAGEIAYNGRFYVKGAP